MYGKARYTVRTFSIRRNEKISCFVTVRGEKALSLIVSLSMLCSQVLVGARAWWHVSCFSMAFSVSLPQLMSSQDRGMAVHHAAQRP